MNWDSTRADGSLSLPSVVRSVHLKKVRAAAGFDAVVSMKGTRHCYSMGADQAVVCGVSFGITDVLTKTFAQVCEIEGDVPVHGVFANTLRSIDLLSFVTIRTEAEEPYKQFPVTSFVLAQALRTTRLNITIESSPNLDQVSVQMVVGSDLIQPRPNVLRGVSAILTPLR